MIDILYSILAFLIVISIIVVTHEFGHYIAARCFGVIATDFAVGWGPTLFKKRDKHGTTWKLCAIPLGGYIKYLGDADATSIGGKPVKLSAQERKHSFVGQSLVKKSVIAIAGPAANFVTAIFILTCMFCLDGRLVASNKIIAVEPNSVAHRSGIQPEDKLISIAGHAVQDFATAERYIKASPNVPLEFSIERNGQILKQIITPEAVEASYGKEKIIIGKLGILPDVSYKKYGVLGSLQASVKDTWNISMFTLKIFGQILTGNRSTKDVGSIIRISKQSLDVMKQGASALAYFIALLSINIGLFNLFPIPPLDGGHILLYVTRGILPKKAADYFENYAIKIGIGVLVVLMIGALLNDIIQLRVGQ
jgi:regulator of sigma E protease